jgi:hypothetical protein
VQADNTSASILRISKNFKRMAFSPFIETGWIQQPA